MIDAMQGLAARLRGRRAETRPWVSTEQYVRRGGARWHPVEAARELEWPSPHRFGSLTIDFEAELPRRSPAFGVLELDEGLLWGIHGWVIGADGTLLPELSWYGGPSDRIRVPRRLPRPRRLRGRCLSLVSDWSSVNYAHFLLDAIGRLALFQNAGSSLDDVDYIYCPVPPSAAAASFLDRVGIPADRRIWAEPGLAVRPDVLLVPSFPGHSLTYQPWLPTFLRQAAGFGDDGQPTRRLYVSRRGSSRQAAQEDSLQALLQERGFELYEPLDHPTQPDDFHDAAVVVGAHGAGLANLAFCRRGVKVLELLPTDNAYPFYYSLAISGGLDYGYLAGPSTHERPPETFGPSPYDFTIDLDELEVALDELLET